MQVARSKLLSRHAFFARLAYKLDLVEDWTQATAATDGVRHFFNPSYVWEKSIPYLIMLWAHEVLHTALLHHLRRGGRDFSTWNEACDYVVNAILKECGFEIPDNWLYSPSFEGMPAEEVYEILKNRKGPEPQPESPPQPQEQDDDQGEDDQGEDDQEQEEDNQGNQEQEEDDNDGHGDDGSDSQGPGNGDPDDQGEADQDKDEEGEGEPDDSQGAPGGMGDGGKPRHTSSPDRPGDVLDYPGEDAGGPSEDDLKRQEQEWKTAVANAEQIAKARGTMPGNLAELVDALLEPKIDWRDVLRHFLERIAANDYSWEQPDRRYLQQGFYLPSLYNHEMGDIVIAVDTSCSRTKTELQQDATEISDILAMYDCTVHLIYVDTRVCGHETYRREDLPLELEFLGRGGTAFSPAFRWVDENNDELNIAAMLYLTDMECFDFPAKAPDYPVLWIQNGGFNNPPPFGELVKM
jgi:predicted metal-dependent peptidase